MRTTESFNLIIAGSRTWNGSMRYQIMREAVFKFLDWHNPHNKPVVIVSGNAHGADKMGETIAEEQHWPIKRMPADWDRYGKAAGYKRNEEMAAIADACLIFWDGDSKGSKHMYDIAMQRKLDVGLITFSVVINIFSS